MPQVSESLIRKMTWLGLLEVGQDSRPLAQLDLKTQNLKFTLVVKLKHAYGTRQSTDKVAQDFRVISSRPGFQGCPVTVDKAGEIKVELHSEMQESGKGNRLNAFVKQAQSEERENPMVASIRIFLETLDASFNSKVAFKNGVRDAGVKRQPWEVSWVMVEGTQEPTPHIGVSGSGGIIKDIGALKQAPTYLKQIGLKGRARLSLVRPIPDQSQKGGEGSATEARVVELPMLQHGAVVDEVVWEQELREGILLTTPDVDKDGVAIRRCDLNATYAAFQKEVCKANFCRGSCSIVEFG